MLISRNVGVGYGLTGPCRTLVIDSRIDMIEEPQAVKGGCWRPDLSKTVSAASTPCYHIDAPGSPIIKSLRSDRSGPCWKIPACREPIMPRQVVSQRPLVSVCLGRSCAWRNSDIWAAVSVHLLTKRGINPRSDMARTSFGLCPKERVLGTS